MRAIFVPANEVRVGPQFGQDDQSTLGFLTYSITCVVIKIMVAPRGGGGRQVRQCLYPPLSGMITAVRQNSHDIANNIQFTLCQLVYKNIQFSCIRFCGKTVKKLA